MKALLLKYKNVFLLLLVSLFFISPLFTNNFYSSNDGEAQVARFGAYIKGFLDGQFPIRWAGDLNYRYGSSVLNFYYPLPGYLSIPLYFTGLSLETIFKILSGISFVVAFLTFYLWTKEFLKKEIALLGALLYGLAPYHFLNLYVRGDVGELMAFSLIPLALLFIDKTLKEKNITNIVLGSSFYALTILSHNSVSLMFSPVLLFYIFLKSKSRINLTLGLFVLFLGLVLSSFFWLPGLYEAKFTNAKLFIGDNYKEHFLSLSNIFYSAWGFGPDVNKEGGLSPHIGAFHLLSLILAFPLFIKTKNKLLTFWLGIIFVSLFITMPASSFVWEGIGILKLYEFPWRFIGLASFAVAAFCALAFSNFNKKIALALGLLLIISSFQYTKINYVHPKSDKFYLDYKETTYYHGEASSVWTAGDFSKEPETQFEIIEGQGEIVRSSKKSNFHSLSLRADTDLTILDNTVYFPGWRVEVNGKKTPIEFQNPNHRGLIIFKVPKGQNDVRIIFGESPIRVFSNSISIFGVLLTSIMFLSRKRIDKYLNDKN
jgi:hypothetical protein